MGAVKDFKPFEGQHCETTATGSLLKHLGIELSEPLLFGIGEGLGYIFWKMKTMESPFLGGRIKPDVLTQNIARNLNLKLEVKETGSVQKAWENIKIPLDQNVPVALKLDCYYLDYFRIKFHFAGHYVAMYGYDENFAYLVDTMATGSIVKTSLQSLELARKEKGPMSSKNLSYTISSKGEDFDLKETILQAIKNNSKDYLNPAISNIGYKGIYKTSKEIKKWFKESKNIESEFKSAAELMEGGGTGGSLFRNLYRDFLKESYELLQIERIEKAYRIFGEVADQWKKVSDLFLQTAETRDVKFIDQASEVLIEISDKEKQAMQLLSEI